MKHSDEMLLWGQRDGELHFIEDVENGLACTCNCPHCSQPLIARNNGEIRTHSFAHFSGAECLKAIESAVHKLAKQVLAETKKLLLPPCFGHGPSGIKEYISKALIDFESIELEKSIFVNNVLIRPDAVAHFHGKELYIEFLFTHSVDDRKTNIIQQKNVSCHEITLLPELQEPGKMQIFLEQSIESKNWIYHKALSRFIEKDVLKAKERQIEKEKRQAEKQRQLVAKQRREEVQQKEYYRKLEQIQKKLVKEKDDWFQHARRKGSVYTACPIKKEFINYYKQTKWGNNEVIQMLEKGVWNNGKIYDNWPNEPVDIFINGKQAVLIPKKEEYDKLSEIEREHYNYLLESVIKYSKLLNFSIDPCSHCSMFVARKYEHIACMYQDGMDIGKCLNYDSI